MSIVIDGTGTISGVSANGGLSAAQTGSVIQVVNATYNTYASSSSSTPADTGLTASITPKFATSKILVIVNCNGCSKNSSATALQLTLFRNTTFLFKFEDFAAYNAATTAQGIGTVSTNYLDSPATTSATSYKVQLASSGNGAIVAINNATTTVSTSTITLMEIAG